MTAHLPVDDARQLYTENTARTWSGLLRVVEEHRDRADGIENELILMLVPVIKHLAQSGVHYPFDVDDFLRVINQAMAQDYAA
jgi:hypothetical protein